MHQGRRPVDDAVSADEVVGLQQQVPVPRRCRRLHLRVECAKQGRPDQHEPAWRPRERGLGIPPSTDTRMGDAVVRQAILVGEDDVGGLDFRAEPGEQIVRQHVAGVQEPGEQSARRLDRAGTLDQHLHRPAGIAKEGDARLAVLRRYDQGQERRRGDTLRAGGPGLARRQFSTHQP